MRLDAHWGMLPADSFQHVGDKRIKPQGGGGGGQPTQSTSYQTNLPEYAQPYVETMLGATQKQLFNMSPETTTTNPDGTTTTTPGQITGFKEYRPYSTDPTQYFAGPSSLQTSAYNAAGQLQSPSQYQTGTQLATMGGLGQLGTTQQAGMYGGMGAGLGLQAARAGQQYQRMATDPNAVEAYMSPYMQNAVDIQKEAAIRDYQKALPSFAAQAARQGAFGGSRSAIERAEAGRTLGTNLANIQAQGQQKAYEDAMKNMQYGSTLGLQGLQAGMQGIGQGLQGVGAQQAGFAGAGQSAATLGQLGSSQQAADINAINLQNQLGSQQQQYQQNIINQAISDYATQQQYPLMQLGFMSNMLRGLPMQASTTQTYQAQPSGAQQALGLGLGALGAYKAFA